MKITTTTGKRGFLRLIITIIIALILASYFFGFNLQEVVENEGTQTNLEYLWNQVKNFYLEYIQPVLNDIWEYIKSFTDSL